MKTYQYKLKDPRWQKKRLEILNRDNWSCIICGNDKATLHVHHTYYENNKEPWEYENKTLLTFCDSCHESESKYAIENKDLLLNAYKKAGLYCGCIPELADAISEMELQHAPDVVASAYAFAFSDQSMQSKIIKMYFEHLANK